MRKTRSGMAGKMKFREVPGGLFNVKVFGAFQIKYLSLL